MLNQDITGRAFGPYGFRVTREQIRALADALGEEAPIYRDPEAARAAGLPDIPAPPTLATCFGLWANPALLAELDALGAHLPRLLHGEQSYSYHAPIYAGDELTARPTIVSVVRKGGQSGAFSLLTLETTLHNQRGELAISDRLVVVVRDGD